MAKAISDNAEKKPGLVKPMPGVEGNKLDKEQAEENEKSEKQQRADMDKLADGGKEQEKEMEQSPNLSEQRSNDMPQPSDEDLVKALDSLTPEKYEIVRTHVFDREEKKSSGTAAAKSHEKAEAVNTIDQDEHARLEKKYGPNYVKAVRRDKTAGMIFSAESWKRLGPEAKDGSKDGWFVDVPTPPEVNKLKTKKA